LIWSINWGLSHTLVLIPRRITQVRTVWSLETSASAHSGAQYKPPGANQEFPKPETLPQYVSHKALAQERSSTQSTTKKKEGGILISVSSIMYI